MGRATLPHSVPDDQHGVRSHHCLGFDGAQHRLESGHEWPDRLEIYVNEKADAEKKGESDGG